MHLTISVEICQRHLLFKEEGILNDRCGIKYYFFEI